MRKRGFADLVGETGAFGRPIAESGAEAVHRHVLDLVQELQADVPQGNRARVSALRARQRLYVCIVR